MTMDIFEKALIPQWILSLKPILDIQQQKGFYVFHWTDTDVHLTRRFPLKKLLSIVSPSPLFFFTWEKD